MIMHSVTISDRISRVAPLGIRFRDTASGNPVGSGLQVILYRQEFPYQRLRAQSNTQGVYYWHDVPGLRHAEFGDGAAQYWAAITPQSYEVEVTDPRGHYLPCKFSVQIPHQGPFTLTCPQQSPPAALPAEDVVLFRAPSASIPPGFGVVRAELHDPRITPANPAAWSILEVKLNSKRLGWGMADRQGRVVVTFPYPAPEVESPLAEVKTQTLFEQKWQLEISASYTQQEPVPEIPNLCLAMTQKPAELWRIWTTTDAPTPLESITLAFGQELVLQSENPADGTLLSKLYLTAAD